MRKIFLTAVVALIISVQSICGAAEIHEAHFNSEENLKYPVVQTGNAAIDEKINAVIFSEIDGFVKDVSDKLYDDELRYIDTNYKVACNEANGTKILSIIIGKNYCYMRAAHPAYYDQTLNFNLTTGELMDKSYLTDIGEGIPESYFIDKITEQLLEYCANKNISLYNDALPLKELPKNFYWDENLHLHFIFNPYDVASYAYGIIDIVAE